MIFLIYLNTLSAELSIFRFEFKLKVCLEQRTASGLQSIAKNRQEPGNGLCNKL